ncbi:MAG: hypothetical protein RI988_4026 [Pseudomonadota bacterium]|jgi:chemotaxis methyl-accepting protein methylase
MPHAPDADIEPVLRMLTERGHPDFRGYKRTTLRRRIERRAGLHGLAGTAEYMLLLRASAQELELLARELLIGVTAFFRDEPVWDALRRHVLPVLLSGGDPQEPFRAWVAGCSTGEEAYSLAMLVREVLDELAPARRRPVQIFATDLNTDAVTVARRAVYPARIVSEVGLDRLQRHFAPAGSSWRVAQPVREMVVFAGHDMLASPPFVRLDLLSCRNVMIYFNTGMQRRMVPTFRYSLRPGGVLMLGHCETIGSFDASFEALDARLRLYRRPDPDHAPRWVPGRDATAANLPDANQEPAMTEDRDSPEPPACAGPLQAATERLLLQAFAPPLVLVDAQGNVLYTSGNTAPYLDPPAGRTDSNVHAMARPGLQRALADAVPQAIARGAVVELPDLVVEGSGQSRRVHVTVRALSESPALAGTVLVSFRDVAVGGVPAPRRRGRRASDRSLEAELSRARDEMQSLREEMGASQEELQAANEELQSTNEELRSTNEELSGSKEELLAINEELHAVNLELQAKLADLALAQSDIRNLLAVSDLAVVFLDGELRVRDFTERARALLALREADLGLPLPTLAERAGCPQLEQAVPDALRTLVVTPCDGLTAAGRRLSIRVRPYLRMDNVISGAVLTLCDAPSA